MNPIISFICSEFNVKDISEIKDTFNNSNNVDIWEPARVVNTTVDLIMNNEGYFCLPPPSCKNTYQPKQKYKGMDVDLSCVSIQNISLRYVKNESKTNLFYLRHNFVPIHSLTQHQQKSKVTKASGRIPDVCFEINPGHDAVLREILFEPNPDRIEMQDYYIKTYMMFDNTQIMNGIIKLDPELCGKGNLTKKGKIIDENDIEKSFDIDYYYLMPSNHVLAWKLHCDDYWRKKNGYFVINIDINNGAYIPFYLIDNFSFEKLKANFIETLQQIDKRPLNALQFELLDKNGNHCRIAPVKLSIHVTFIAYPNTKPYPLFKPSLDPSFIQYERVLQRQRELEMFLKEEREYQDRVNNLKLTK